MNFNAAKDLEKEYQGRYGWRLEDNLQRMIELQRLTGNTGGLTTIEAYPQLKYEAIDKTPENALLISIFLAWCEVCDCFIFGDFQAVVLLCRAIAERSLKLEYIKNPDNLPLEKYSTLGIMINKCKDIVMDNILNSANDLKRMGDDRAHALLENNAPPMAIRGGQNRGITVTSSTTYTIEPFRGDAVAAVEKTHLILHELYGQVLATQD